MTNGLSVLAIVSAIFLIIGIAALIARNETISTRQSGTQWLMLCVGIGGLIGIKGYYAIGITISVVAIIAYFVRWRRFRKEQKFCEDRGMCLPEYKKP